MGTRCRRNLTPSREVARVDNKAQRYAFSGKNEVETSNVMITGTILVYD